MFLNNTSASTAESCMRKHYWTRESNILGGQGLQTPYINDNLVFGQIVHVGLAELYRDSSVSQAIRASVDYGKTEGLPFDELPWDEKNKWLDHFEWIGRILTAYDKYRHDADEFSVLQIENEGCVVLGEICYKCGEPYPVLEGPQQQTFFECQKCYEEVHHWVFRTDLVINREILGQEGGAYVFDHKTASSVGDNYLASWHHSFQLAGYSYGYQKYSGMPIRGYGVNILRKLKTIGQEVKDTKRCSKCRNGKRARIGCETCSGNGMVPREPKPADQPFTREWASFNEEIGERFVRQRLNTIERIRAERERFEVEPDVAWPMNPSECYNMGKCPFIKLCYGGDPERWWEPPLELMHNFEAKDADYVSVREMAKEEMK